MLRRHFADEKADYVFLVDEAHNLADRAREMFSAEIDSREIDEVRRAIQVAVPPCAKALSRLSSAVRKLGRPPKPTAVPTETAEPNPDAERELFSSERISASAAGDATDPTPRQPIKALRNGIQASHELPTELVQRLEKALVAAEAWLAGKAPDEFRGELLELYFRLLSFARTAENYDEHYLTIIQPGPPVRVRLFCVDPSLLLRQGADRGKAAVFFSATLTPIEYYRELLGGSPEDPALQLPSPFPPSNLAVLVQDRVRTHFKSRAETLDEVVETIGAVAQGRRGNYLVYLPSYQYLTGVREQFQLRFPSLSIRVQRPGMTELEREAFLAAFSAEHGETLVGFAVMGGIFGEGVDLVGERLIGAIIVGVGLPQLCAERDLILDYFQQKTGAGFDYAYSFPGMNRVLQAAGRVIRSETDRGVVMLIDTRFAERRYWRLLPGWWRPVPARNLQLIRTALSQFWEFATAP